MLISCRHVTEVGEFPYTEPNTTLCVRSNSVARVASSGAAGTERETGAVPLATHLVIVRVLDHS